MHKREREETGQGGLTIAEALNRAPFSPFHLRALFATAVGFFASAYELFIIGIALELIREQWHLSARMTGLVGGIAFLATVAGAFTFGHLADRYGRKSIYGIEAGLMVLGALLSAAAQNITMLLIARAILGFGIGGDYPLSAVLMTEYANTKTRGRMVALVFSAQALGLIAGPMMALSLLVAGVDHDLAWRIMLALGALPAAAVIYARRRLPESPRWLARARGQTLQATHNLLSVTRGTVINTREDPVIRESITRYWKALIGTAGTWFIFDYAYYGNTISTPLIMRTLSPNAGFLQNIALSLLVFSVAAVPGYILAILSIDHIGHRRLQLIGFGVLSAAFFLLGELPELSGLSSIFILVYSISYLFSEFGPNTTTFILSAELFPVNLRTTCHGISTGIAKIGAFLGAFLFPVILSSVGLYNTLKITAMFSLLGFGVTWFFIREPAGQSLELLSGEISMDAVKTVPEVQSDRAGVQYASDQ